MSPGLHDRYLAWTYTGGTRSNFPARLYGIHAYAQGMRKTRIPDNDYTPIPDGIPAESLAYRWCAHQGRRSDIHYSFKRWLYPGDYDKDEVDAAIDASLKEYPQALEAFPERPAGTDDMVWGAERLIKTLMEDNGVHQGIALGVVRRWRPDLYVEYTDRIKSDKSVRARFCRMGSPGQNRLAREWLRQAFRQTDQS